MVVAAGMDISFDGGPAGVRVELDRTPARPAMWAGRLAALADRWLVLAHMISPSLVAALGVPHAPAAAATVGLIEAEERTAGECLREALAQLRLPPGARGDVAVRIGPAIVGLAEIAEDLHADAIVVGAHRRGPVREVVLGSLWRSRTRLRAP